MRGGDGVGYGEMLRLTFADPLDGPLQVAVSLFDGQDEVGVRPVREQLLQCGQLRRVALLELAQLALLCRCVQLGRRAVAVGVPRSSRAIASSSSAAAGSRPAAGRPALCFRHVSCVWGVAAAVDSGCVACVRAVERAWVRANDVLFEVKSGAASSFGEQLGLGNSTNGVRGERGRGCVASRGQSEHRACTEAGLGLDEARVWVRRHRRSVWRAVVHSTAAAATTAPGCLLLDLGRVTCAVAGYTSLHLLASPLAVLLPSAVLALTVTTTTGLAVTGLAVTAVLASPWPHAPLTHASPADARHSNTPHTDHAPHRPPACTQHPGKEAPSAAATDPP